MGKELWKVIPGYERYAVSNTGKVKALETEHVVTYGSYITGEHLLKTELNNHGYHYVRLWGAEKDKKMYVHRLVALLFIPNPNNLPHVNHIDCNPANNHVENLEWCTPKSNAEWMVKMGRNKRTEEWLMKHRKAMERLARPVIGTNIKTGEVIVFKKLTAVKEKGFSAANVCRCCQNKEIQHKGYTWRYMEG